MTTTSNPLTPVFDGHNDTLLHIAKLPPDDEWSFFERNDTGAIDLPRAREGGMVGGIFAIFPPPQGKMPEDAKAVSPEGGFSIPQLPRLPFEVAREFTTETMELLFELEEQSQGEFFVARDIEMLRDGIDDGRMGAVLHFEGAEAIDEDLEFLERYYDDGLRSLGIVWSRSNAFGHGVPFRYPCSPDTGPGLTEAGGRLVQACNELGIMVDMAHLNEAGFWDVADLSDSPLVVSHACCHAICPSARNITDEQLDAIGESGGLIGINFFVGDLREDGDFRRDASVDQLVRHIDYAAQRIGIDHVAFGSDFDGARVPLELGDASGFPVLIQSLRQAGFDEESIQKIACDNWLRVLEQSWNSPTKG